MLGHIVKPKSNDFLLRSGCSAYAEAVCVSEDPFVLVSPHGDMRWQSTVEADNFIIVRVATQEEMTIANKRPKNW